jgi:hypothetical protein
MARIVFALIYTGFVLPGLLLAPPADALSMTSPTLGCAAGIHVEMVK